MRWARSRDDHQPDLTDGELGIRPTRLSDLAYVLALERAPENRDVILSWTFEQHRTSLRAPDIYHGIVLHADVPVGFVIVTGCRSVHRSVEITRIVIGDKGRGFGRRTLRLVTRAAFEVWHAHRLWLDVMEENHRAIALYGSEGFTVDGRLREAILRGGRYHTLVVMSLIEGECPSVRATPTRSSPRRRPW